MPKVTILPHPEICPEGAVLDDVSPGENLCRALLRHKIDVEHACELSCACTTCHVILRGGFDSVNEASEREEDLLDQAWGLEAQSRLSCQTRVGEQDLIVEIPRHSINHAREN